MKAYGKTDEIAARAAEEAADVVIDRSGGPVAEPIYTYGRMRKVAKNGVGLDTIDLVAASQHKISVMITVGANALSVAEQALALMCAVARSLH
jgi:D-3-phosphoglycerate dehydrogenase